MPEVIERVQTFKAETLGNPAIPFPWPPYVPKPEALDKQIAYLLKVYEEGEDKEVRTGGELGRARNELKTCFSQLARVIWFRDRRTLKAQKGGSLCKTR